MIEHRTEFETWYLNHDQLPKGGLDTVNWNDPQKEYYFYTETKMMHELFCQIKAEKSAQG